MCIIEHTANLSSLYIEARTQLFTFLMTDFLQDINRVTMERFHKGIAQLRQLVHYPK